MKSGMQVIMILNLTIFPYKWLKFKCYQLMLVFSKAFSQVGLATVLFFLFYVKKRRRGGFHLAKSVVQFVFIFKTLRTKTNWVRVLEFRSHNMYLHLDIKCFLTIFKLVQGCASIPQIFRNSLDFGGGKGGFSFDSRFGYGAKLILQHLIANHQFEQIIV